MVHWQLMPVIMIKPRAEKYLSAIATVTAAEVSITDHLGNLPVLQRPGQRQREVSKLPRLRVRV